MDRRRIAEVFSDLAYEVELEVIALETFRNLNPDVVLPGLAADRGVLPDFNFSFTNNETNPRR